MSEEKTFLNQANMYVSNSRIVLGNTTYATANITSVKSRVSPAPKGCAILLILAGVLVFVSGLGIAIGDPISGIMALILGGGLIAAGVYGMKSMQPTFHIILASASGESDALSSKDKHLIDEVTEAISLAITSRG